LIQSNQKSSHQKCFFAALGLCRTIRKNSRGRNLFAGLPYRFNTFYAKSSYAPTHFTGLLFFRIFSEALLLTRKLRHINISSAKRKASVNPYHHTVKSTGG